MIKPLQMKYETPIRMKYAAEEVWFPLSEAVGSWDAEFHELMLNDAIRMNAYQQAIHGVVHEGMTVADIGTGTGILAAWALEAGAAKVYGIDMRADMLERAKTRIDSMGYTDRFMPICSTASEVSIPRVDVVISEILGNLGDNENMVQILRDVRQRLLKPDGLMLPRRVTISLVPVSAPVAHDHIRRGEVRALNDLYGMKMFLGQRNRFKVPYDAIIPHASYLAELQPMVTWNMTDEDQETYIVQREFVVKVQGVFTGFAGFFVAQLSDEVVLDISGDDIAGRTTSDCWKHAFFPIENPMHVEEGDVIALRYERYLSGTFPKPGFQTYRWSGAVIRDRKEIGRF